VNGATLKIVLPISHKMLESQACVLALLSELPETNVHSKIILSTDTTGNRDGTALLVVIRMGNWESVTNRN
jgi:hypothetical protein